MEPEGRDWRKAGILQAEMGGKCWTSPPAPAIPLLQSVQSVLGLTDPEIKRLIERVWKFSAEIRQPRKDDRSCTRLRSLSVGTSAQPATSRRMTRGMRRIWNVML